jgi:hypothetical protein
MRGGYLGGLAAWAAFSRQARLSVLRQYLRALLTTAKHPVARAQAWFANPQQQFTRLVAHIEHLVGQTPTAQ